MEVKSPSLVSSGVFEKSGHSAKYKSSMYYIEREGEEESQLALRPMSCPNHIIIYKSQKRSYKELPLRLFEFGEVFRNESSGALQLLFRQRQFCQDDSHVFVEEVGLKSALVQFVKLSALAYAQLGFKKIKYAISLRPKERFGHDDLWDKAEQGLREACIESDVEWIEQEGGGAFYGPKLELQAQDKLGRFWQLGVIQLDYVLPERFDLEYVDRENNRRRPIMLHHAILGSLERMIGILLENCGCELPIFLRPIEKVVVAVSEKSRDYGLELARRIGAIFDESDDPLGKKLAH